MYEFRYEYDEIHDILNIDWLRAIGAERASEITKLQLSQEGSQEGDDDDDDEGLHRQNVDRLLGALRHYNGGIFDMGAAGDARRCWKAIRVCGVQPHAVQVMPSMRVRGGAVDDAVWVLVRAALNEVLKTARMEAEQA